MNGYLIEITAHIFRKVDDKSGKRLIDVILDEARQKGTGMWTSEDAMALHVPVLAIDVAVAMRRNVGAEERAGGGQPRFWPCRAAAFHGATATRCWRNSATRCTPP